MLKDYVWLSFVSAEQKSEATVKRKMGNQVYILTYIVGQSVQYVRCQFDFSCLHMFSNSNIVYMFCE